jgi:hypothetical protein
MPVIPAKAGIQSVEGAFPKLCGRDSRFRGNDCGMERWVEMSFLLDRPLEI